MALTAIGTHNSTITGSEPQINCWFVGCIHVEKAIIQGKEKKHYRQTTTIPVTK